MKYIGIGTVIALVTVGISIVIANIQTAASVVGIIGMLLLLGCIITSASFPQTTSTEGMHMHERFVQEDAESRHTRQTWTTRMLLLALPNLLAAVSLYVLL